MTDLLAVRTFAGLRDFADDFAEPVLQEFARESCVPVVNMESAMDHPLQALADLLTMQEEFGGPGFRVYVGQKGAMKLMPMVSMASDSAGEIFATKNGQLKIVADRDGKSAFWIKGGKKTELTVLPPPDNRYLIYRELGIYGQLGAICDDQ